MSMIDNGPAPKNKPILPKIGEEASISLDKIINIDDVKPNSIIIFKTKNPNQSLILAIKNFIAKYGSLLESKNCSLLFLKSDISLEVLDETEMEKAGWQKKNKSNLILPH